MNENIKFINDSARGTYAKDDTGLVIAFSRDCTDSLVAVVRLTDGSYITAPLTDIMYVDE